MSNLAGVDLAVEYIADRLSVWIAALKVEFAEARARFESGNDQAAASFLAILHQVLDEHSLAFDKYRSASTASADDRFRWFGIVGSGLAGIVYQLETLDGALAPRLTPLVGAFERILTGLLPGHQAVFRSFREFNYELTAIHADAFRTTLGDKVDSLRWPALFIKFPTGFLDSPRNHILVAHEIGHALAAVRRAESNRHQQDLVKAKRAGKPAPVAPPALVPAPQIDGKELVQIVMARWNELGLPALQLTIPQILQQKGTEARVLTDMVASVASTANTMCADWTEELFADAVGVLLFGPAFVFSFIEVLMPVSGLQSGDQEHPPGAMRVISMAKLLDGQDLKGMVDALPSGLRQRYEAWVEMANSELITMKATTAAAQDSESKLQGLVCEAVEKESVALRAAAQKACISLMYLPAEFQSDIKNYVDDFVISGIPPIVAVNSPKGSLATIFNVAQLVALDRLDEFRPGEQRPEKESRLDDLVLKAVELAEIQRIWQEVQA